MNADKESWDQTEYFCPCCGEKEVWHELGGGDYYVGENFMCRKCGAAFYLPNGATFPHYGDRQAKQRLDAIRGASTAGENGER